MLFDPVINSNKPGKEINLDSIEADYFLLSHGHEDYAVELESVAKKNEAKLISNFGLTTYFGEENVDSHQKNHRAVFELPIVKAKLVSYTCFSVLPDETYCRNPGDFVIETREETLYSAANLALGCGMKGIPYRGFEVDVAMLPVGDNFTMGPKKAVKASEFNRCDRIIGVLFDTFPYIKIDHSGEKNILQKGKAICLPEVGEKLEI